MRQLTLFDKCPPRDPQELREKFPNLGTAWKPRANPRYVGDRYKRVFTLEEMQWTDVLGSRMWERGLKRRYKTRYGLENDSQQALKVSDTQGVRAEVALCGIEDLAYPPDYLDRFRLPDLGPIGGPGICVRCSAHKYPSLIVQPYDPDDSIAVLVHEVVPGEYIAHFWCWVADAHKHVPLTDPPVRMHDGKQVEIDNPAHFVRAHHLDPDGNRIAHFLRSGEEDDPLPKRFLDLCPKGYRVW